MKSTPELLICPTGIIDAEIVREAWEDWQLAQAYFSWVSDPDLVDFAIFWERAARLRYIYLLRCLKKEGRCLSFIDVVQLVVR